MFAHVFYKNEFVKTMKFDKSESEIFIGRADENEIALPFDSMVSRRHLKVVFEKGKIFIEDLKSKNGVYIDGKRVEKSYVDVGKRIFLGNSSIIFSQKPLTEIKKSLSINEKLFDGLRKEDNFSKNALTFLYHFSNNLDSYKDTEELTEDLFEKLIEKFHPDRIILFDVIKKGKGVSIRKITDVKFFEERQSYSQSIINEVLKTKKALFIQNVAQEIVDPTKSIRALGVSSLIAVPIFSGRDFIGILQLEFFNPQKSFLEEDFYLICVLADILRGVIKGAETINQIRMENKIYNETIKGEIEIIGEDKATRELRGLIKKLAKTDTTVLITGESGTGKELVAKSIHFQSKRKNKPFVILNCAAIPSQLAESELFGHERGAFTGADKKRIGKLEAANGGTIFLDEIGDMDIQLQTKLLRFLETGEVQPIGSNVFKYSNVRVIAATNVDLKKAVAEGKFRKDLYYRLSVFKIKCLPLRERKKDIVPLAEYFLQRYSEKMGKNIKKISKKALQILLNYNWPGNVRELKNIMERSCVVGYGEELLEDFLPEDIKEPLNNKESLVSFNGRFVPLNELEKEYIKKVLESSNFNKAKTAKVLNISRKTLYTKLKVYGIT